MPSYVFGLKCLYVPVVGTYFKRGMFAVEYVLTGMCVFVCVCV